MIDLEDPRFVERLRARDERAFNDLVRASERRVYGLVFRMLGRRDESEDLTQEVFVQVFKAIDQFRGDSKLSTWIYRIAVNLTKNRTKYNARRHAGEQDDVADTEGHAAFQEARGVTASDVARPDEAYDGHEVEGVVQRCIASLEPDFREVLVLRDVEGLSAEEAAKVVGIEVGALKSRLHRARLDMREHLIALLGEADSVSGAPPCPELQGRLSEYTASDIDQATCAAIEAHLQECPRCKTACDSLRRSVSLCRQIPGDSVPKAVRAAVRHALHEALATTGGSPTSS